MSLLLELKNSVRVPICYPHKGNLRDPKLLPDFHSSSEKTSNVVSILAWYRTESLGDEGDDNVE